MIYRLCVSYTHISGLSSKLSTREELNTLLAIAIFTSTAQHAATNNGQVRNTHTLRIMVADMLKAPSSVLTVWNSTVHSSYFQNIMN